MTSIVFVEDKQAAPDALSNWFSETRPDWQIRVATSADIANDFVEQQPISCVIGDMNSSAVCGLELFAHVARNQPDAVRIAISDSENVELTLESLHATHRFITRPECPEKLCTAIERSLELRVQLQDPLLCKIVSGITSLPVLPEIYNRLMLELASEDYSIDTVSNIIASDISLTATLLKTVNSPYYGLVQHVHSPAHAVNLLGIEVVKNILLSENVISQFKHFSPRAARIAEINAQASIRGVLANRFSRLANLSKREIDHCQIAGMLSLLGDLVLETGMIDSLQLASTPYQPEIIGSSILSLWSLPDCIVESVLHQNNVAAPAGNISPMHVLHTICLLENAYAANGHQFDDAFDLDTLFSNHPLNSDVLSQWFDCFCDYHMELDIAA